MGKGWIAERDIYEKMSEKRMQGKGQEKHKMRIDNLINFYPIKTPNIILLSQLLSK